MSIKTKHDLIGMIKETTKISTHLKKNGLFSLLLVYKMFHRLIRSNLHGRSIRVRSDISDQKTIVSDRLCCRTMKH